MSKSYNLNEPLKRELDENYSTGIKDMDTIIGGYPRGGFVLLELMDDSLSWLYMPVLYHTISDFLLNDRGVVYMVEDGPYTSSVRKLLLDYLGEDEELLAKNLRMPFASEVVSETETKIVTDVCSVKEYLDMHSEVYKGLKKPVLHLLGLTALNIYADDEIKRILSEIVSRVKRRADLLIGILKPSARLKNEICEMADIHLRLVPINDTLNLYGVKPYTVIYNISPVEEAEEAEEAEEENQYHQLKLTPYL